MVSGTWDGGSATAANRLTASSIGVGRNAPPAPPAAASRPGSAGFGIAFSDPAGPPSPPRKPCTRALASSRVVSSAFRGMSARSTRGHKEPGVEDAAAGGQRLGHGRDGVERRGHRAVLGIEQIATMDPQLALAAVTQHLAQEDRRLGRGPGYARGVQLGSAVDDLHARRRWARGGQRADVGQEPDLNHLRLGLLRNVAELSVQVDAQLIDQVERGNQGYVRVMWPGELGDDRRSRVDSESGWPSWTCWTDGTGCASRTGRPSRARTTNGASGTRRASSARGTSSARWSDSADGPRRARLTGGAGRTGPPDPSR